MHIIRELRTNRQINESWRCKNFSMKIKILKCVMNKMAIFSTSSASLVLGWADQLSRLALLHLPAHLWVPDPCMQWHFHPGYTSRMVLLSGRPRSSAPWTQYHHRPFCRSLLSLEGLAQFPDIVHRSLWWLALMKMISRTTWVRWKWQM